MSGGAGTRGGGGGGGGAGTTGGSGGDGFAIISPGGAGGAVGVDRGNGAGGGGNGSVGMGFGMGGGGGGGGAHGFRSVGPGPYATTNGLTGGNGGNGGNSDIAGGGGGGGAGGYGLIIEGGGASSNAFAVTGGNGGSGGNGGASNNGSGGGSGGDGGIGVLLSANNAAFTIAAEGAITGGQGGRGGRGSQGGRADTIGLAGVGGAGLSFTGNNATLTNNSFGQGVSFFGIGGGAGGDGGGTFNGPTGTNGGVGGNAVEFLGANGTFTNNGSVFGGTGGRSSNDGTTAGTGGAGAYFAAGGTLTNNGTISGGAGGDGAGFQLKGGSGGIGGAGVSGTGLTITNAGTIAGGQGGVVDLGKASGNGGFGGSGVVGSNLAITNMSTGTIIGGTGGAAMQIGLTNQGNGTGGAGGVGILADNATIINRGTIQGGDGGNALNAGAIGVGGIGIVGSNLTIDNAGSTISGGSAGVVVQPTIPFLRLLAAAPPPGGPQNYAIQFTGGTNTVGTGGTITGGIYVAAGSFQPALNGTAPGTALNVSGPINFAPGSVYNVRVTPAASDRAVANTSALGAPGISTVTGASVNASFGNGTYQLRQYTILTAAAGVVGTFSGLTFNQNFAFLTPTLSYDANNVFLNIAPTNPVTSVNGRQVPNYVPVAITYNQISVARGLTDAGILNNGRGPILNALNQLSAPQARAAFDALSGEGITGAQNVAFRSTQLFTSSIFDQTTFYSGAANSVTLCDPLPGQLFSPRDLRNCGPIRELADLPARSFQPVEPAPANRTWRAWATGWGGTEHISSNAFPIGSATQNNSLYGGSLGVDYQLLPNYLIGVAVGGSNGDFRIDQRGTSGTTTGGHVAFYDLLTLGNWYGASSTSFSYFGNKTTRFVNGFGGLGSETLRGNFDSHEFRSRLEIGRHFTSLPLLGGLPTLAGFGTVTPFVALEIAELRSNGFNEYAQRGAGNFRLNVSGQSLASAPAYAGLRFQRVTPLGNGMVLSPTLQLAYVHEFAPYRNQIGQIISLPGSTFLVDGARPARDAAQVKAGAELAISPRSAIFANFDGEFSGVNQLYAGKGGFRYTW